jgi:hypothetical protein
MHLGKGLPMILESSAAEFALIAQWTGADVMGGKRRTLKQLTKR